MSWSVRGLNRAQKSLDDAPKNFKLGLRDAGHIAGRTLVRTAHKGILNGTKSGRLYGGHQASASGEYPANLSGQHLKSINYKFSGDIVRFSANAPHSGYLEYGTKKMFPRPTIANADKDAGPTVHNILIRIPFQRLSK